MSQIYVISLNSRELQQVNKIQSMKLDLTKNRPPPPSSFDTTAKVFKVPKPVLNSAKLAQVEKFKCIECSCVWTQTHVHAHMQHADSEYTSWQYGCASRRRTHSDADCCDGCLTGKDRFGVCVCVDSDPHIHAHLHKPRVCKILMNTYEHVWRLKCSWTRVRWCSSS